MQRFLVALMLGGVVAVGGVAPAIAAEPTSPANAAPHSAWAAARDTAAGWVTRSVEMVGGFATGLKDGVQATTGLSDAHMTGIGIGVLAGVAAADVLGTGGLGSLAVVGMGGLIGNWVVERQSR